MTPILALALLLALPQSQPVAEGLTAILAVGREGTGNEAAAAGWKAVVAAGPDALIPTLSAFPRANPTALNWLRLAATAIPAPADPAPLFAFVRDESRHPAARRIAFDTARSRDPAAAAALLATRTGDRDLGLRRDAIAANLPLAKSTQQLQALFAAARDVDQCEAIAKSLADLGVAVELPAHYGVVTQWQVLGPLDAPKSAGYPTVYAPERGYDPAMTLDGKGGVKATWKPVQATTADGKIDFNTTLAKQPDAVAFLAAEFESPRETAAELRLSTPNAVRVYFNGVEVLGKAAYHQGQSRDQYVARGVLKAGRNRVLVKVCQDDQPPSWAKVWELSARLCDETGGALPVQQRLADSKLVPLAQLPPPAAPKPTPKESK